MAKSMQFFLQVQANLGGNLSDQLKGLQGQMNALKTASQFSTAFGNNLGAAMRYANNAADAAKMAAQMNADFNPNPKLLNDLSKLQSQQRQIQEYKEALREKARLQQVFQNQVIKNSQAAANRQAAAQKVSDLKVQLESFKAAQAGLKRTSAEYKNLQAQIKATKAEIKAANDALKVADSTFKNQRQATAATGANFSSQISQLRQLQGALSSAGVGLNQLGAAEMRLQGQINSTTAALARQQAAAASRANFSNSVDNFGEKYSNFQNATQTAQTIMSPFTSAAQNAMTYEYELQNVKALTQLKNIRAGNLDVVNAQMSAMDKTFRHLGATTEYTSTQVAQSAGYFAMAGWDSERIQAVMPAFINLATATRTSGQELARLADTFSDDMTAAGLQAGKMITYGLDKSGNALQMEASEYFTNAMAYAVTNANLNRESLHEGVKYFAPVAKNLGLDVAEMFATTMLTANAGIKGSQMGTAFRSGLIRLVAPTKGAASALAEMGMTMSDAQKQYHEAGAELEKIGISANATFSEKLAGISQYLSGVDQAKKTDFINAVFGKNAFSAWAEIFSDPSKVAQIAEYTNTMRSEQMVGYAGDTANVMRDSTQIQWEYVKSGLDAVINQIGTALLPSITAIAQSLAPILTDFAEWISQNQELVVALAGVAAAISAIIVGAAGIQLISAAWGMVTASATLASGAISTAVTFLRGLSFSSIAASISSMGTAFMAAARGAMAFIFTPVGAVIAAIAAGAYLIYQNWDKVGPVFKRAADMLKTAFTGAIEFVSGLWDGLVEKFGKLKEFFSFNSGSENLGKNAFDFSKNVPTYQSASLGNVSQIQPAQQIQPVQTLDLTQIQSQIDNLGNSLTYNFDNFNTNLQSQSTNLSSSLGNILSTAESTVAQVESANAAISESAAVNSEVQANLQSVNANISESVAAVNANAAEISNETAAVTQNTAEVVNHAATVQTSTASIQNMTSAADTSIASIQNMASSADNSTGAISSLASAANSAASSLSGLGSAVSSAISSIQVAGANAAASISAGNVAHNANGGIHTGGQFLSWINEKGPEAIIPLDGSSRAINLWQATGKILGIEPQNNFAGNIFNSSGNSIFVPRQTGIFGGFNFPKIFTGTSWNPNLPNPNFSLPIPNFSLPNFGGLFQNLRGIFNGGFNFGGLFQNLRGIFNGGFNFGGLFQNLRGIFGGLNSPSIFQGGGIWEQILNPNPTFPQLETPGGFNQPTLQPVFNFTFNITANNPQEFQQAMPQIRRSFEEEFDDWLSERRRRDF